MEDYKSLRISLQKCKPHEYGGANNDTTEYNDADLTRKYMRNESAELGDSDSEHRSSRQCGILNSKQQASC